MLLGVQWYDGKRAEFIGESWFANRFLGCFPGTPRTEFTSAGESNVAWAAVHNQFFAMIASPAEPALRVVARQVKLPPPTAAERAEEPSAVLAPLGYQTALVYPAVTLGAGGVLERKVDLFAGPKEYNTLAKLPKDQDQAMNFTTFFGWFARALLLSMNGIHHTLGLQYGVAIIVITIIIKLLFWPLTQASTRSMKRMAQLQPQMKAIQEKYKDDPKKMNLKLMEFMKENRVSPLGGCLPILLQIPVFIGFYQMLQSAIELRGASFLWACDLSQSDTIGYIFGFPINPLPLIMGATQFWQARMTPPSPGMDPVQAKMMQYMPLIFIFILYNFSSGLALYWTVQNLLSILQMKLTKNAPPTPPAPVAPTRPVTGSSRKK
jgi:YidC/Oxa1 family membrane protein insertase